MDYQLAEYVIKLADSCIKLSENEKDLTTISKSHTELLKSLLGRVRALESQETIKCEVFVTTNDGYCFPVGQFNSVREAYYWIASRFEMTAEETSFLFRLNYVNFSVEPRTYKSFKVIRCQIR